jgi:putative ABC transport system ATP-binding protein
VIHIEDIRVKKKDKVVLDAIHLTVQKGEKILLTGESGSGKSTLLKSILFFEEFSGTIFFNGTPIDEGNLTGFRGKIGYIGQLLPIFDQPVLDFIQMPFGYKANRDKKFDDVRLDTLLARLHFDASVLDKNFSDLSGGEKQRILILQVLLLDKPIYLFDEITSALDRKNIEKVVSLITGDKDKTIISISHNPEWRRYCDRVVEIKDGKISACPDNKMYDCEEG